MKLLYRFKHRNFRLPRGFRMRDCTFDHTGRSTNDMLMQAIFRSSPDAAERLYTQAEINALADAMWQLLDDMKERGLSVCLAAKAEARIAFEPFRDGSEGDLDDWMTVEQAEQILREAG